MSGDAPDPLRRPRRLILVTGDQLDLQGTAFEDVDPTEDAVWMAEVREETEHVWCHKLRIAAFLSAMRHFRDALRERGLSVHYTELPRRPSEDRGRSLSDVLERDLHRVKPASMVMAMPGDHRVRTTLLETAARNGIDLEVREDGHFYCTRSDFEGWAHGRKNLRLEDFYRWMRRRHRVLVDAGGEPAGGRWNFDSENRRAFDESGPPPHKAPRRFTPDATTRQVLELVGERFADHPGRLDHFDLPVTHAQARALLRDFVTHRLAGFGRWQDAMWEGEPYLFHSRLSFALNLKLVSPRSCVDAAVEAWERGEAPIESVEGFVRQILGWREFVRGVYWREMPGYASLNGLDARESVPRFYWDGDTDMACAADALRSVIDHGYAHHIQRLMVLGLFALLLGVRPIRFHEWHLAMYLDAVDWVSLPNTLGMSQWADGGLVASKPYAASARYIERMSNHCRGCRYDPGAVEGEGACPFNLLYWDFLARHREPLSHNHRMRLQLANLDRKGRETLRKIRADASALRRRLREGARV